MTQENKTKLNNELGVIIGFVESFGISRDYYYLSTPITGGPIFYNLTEKYLNRGEKIPKEIFYKEIILPNINSAEEAEFSLRKKGLEKIINPAKFDLMKSILQMDPKWHEESYLQLWENTIYRFVNQIIFNDGWEYSYGALTEWQFYQEKSRKFGMKPPLDINLQLITQKKFEEKVSNAIINLQGRGLNTSRIEDRFKLIKEFHNDKKE